jgi:hypothetical protein
MLGKKRNCFRYHRHIHFTTIDAERASLYPGNLSCYSRFKTRSSVLCATQHFFIIAICLQISSSILWIINTSIGLLYFSGKMIYDVNKALQLAEESYPGRRIQSPYTLVNDRILSVFLRIRPYFGVLHGSVLRYRIRSPFYSVFVRTRSYFSVYGHGDIRS